MSSLFVQILYVQLLALEYRVNTFGHKKIGAKTVVKMLVKLTPQILKPTFESNKPVFIYSSLAYLRLECLLLLFFKYLLSSLSIANKLILSDDSEIPIIFSTKKID